MHASGMFASFLALLALGCGVEETVAARAPATDDSHGEGEETAATPCYGEGEEYFAKELDQECCPGLVGVSAEDIPRDDYTQDDYPEGCGPAPGVPPDLVICVACGDGTCGLDEHFCNCPSDCELPRPSVATFAAPARYDNASETGLRLFVKTSGC